MVLGPDPAKLQAYAPVRDPFCATPSGPTSVLRRPGQSRTGATTETRPGIEELGGRRKPRVQVGVAGATPKKQLIVPAVDMDSACSSFVQFTPPRARVSGPHDWDYGRVHALLGTGEIAHHMHVYTGFAELLFVACAQSAPPRDPCMGKKRKCEAPMKILVAVATTGWCWMLSGGLHQAPETRRAARGCCSSRPPDDTPRNRYSRSVTGWEGVRRSFHVDGKCRLSLPLPLYVASVA